jgi:hypothetical protein
MRAYFDLADLRHAQISSTNDEQPSLYSGADDDVLKAAAAAVIDRGKFLFLNC